jgi:thiol-disulfide isomerase/thioredoxin
MNFKNFIYFNCLLLLPTAAFSQGVAIKLHIRGVYESKITLLPLIGTNALKPIVERAGIKNGETTSISVSKAQLPAEFVLRFDYKEKETSTPYPCEKHIIVNEQNLELWVNPMYCNNKDSSYFQKDEKENTLFTQFTKENGKQKEKLELLQNFLMNYDETQSQFYQQGIKEYEKRCSQYNQWLKEQATQYKELFVSHTFQFQYLPQIDFKGSEEDTSPRSVEHPSPNGEGQGARLQRVLAHYFDGIDFQDTLLLHTQELKNFITAYVNLYASLAKTQAELDSLYPLIGKTAIEKARLGNPKVYGWMVDYFYKGYESTNMPAGIKMLEPYLNDTTCLTTKRQAIEKRLKGIKTLTIGTLAPDFTLKDDAGKDVLFSKYKTNSRYKLLLFWSADCGHCKDLVSKLYPWWQQLSDKTLVEVFALSLDDTDTEIPIWQNAITQLQGWKHIRCEGGVNSPEANAYFILSTPVMFLIDNKTNKICAIPENVQQLINIVNR